MPEPSTEQLLDETPTSPPLGFIGRYLATTPSNIMLVHGVASQLAGVVFGHISSSMNEPFGVDVPPISRFFSPSWGFNLLANATNIAGWALVIFACSKVIAEALRERE